MNRIVRAGLFSLTMGVAALAQNEGQLASEFRLEGMQFLGDCSAFKKAFSCLEDIATAKPVHLTASSIAPQNSVGFGPAFVYDKNVGESWRTSTNADAVVSTNESWRAGVYFKAIHTSSKPPSVLILQHRPTGPAHLPVATLQAVPEFNFYAQAISLNKVDFYGLGPSSSRSSLASFEMREVITGGNVTYPVIRNSGLALLGEVNGRWVDIRPAQQGTIPSIGQLYTNATAPGLASQPGYLQPGGGLLFARSFSDILHLDYSAVFQEFAAVNDSRYSFQRLNLDFLHDIPLHRKQRSAPVVQSAGPDESPASLETNRFTYNRQGTVELEARITESFASAGHEVPFYFQPTLGGADLNGEKMLASYADYRFRAPNLILFRASIEHSIWGPIGAMFQADTGKVALNRGDIGFDHFLHSYAAGLTVRAGGFPMVQLLFAWGGHEGTHSIAYINPIILGGGGRPSLY
ncbi:MAG: hypothetical protein JO323_06660 [Acidobacteriia bacterium]|nr:hypothetical protein [Terriglobia bacterium]